MWWKWWWRRLRQWMSTVFHHAAGPVCMITNMRERLTFVWSFDLCWNDNISLQPHSTHKPTNQRLMLRISISFIFSRGCKAFTSFILRLFHQEFYIFEKWSNNMFSVFIYYFNQVFFPAFLFCQKINSDTKICFVIKAVKFVSFFNICNIS